MNNNMVEILEYVSEILGKDTTHTYEESLNYLLEKVATKELTRDEYQAIVSVIVNARHSERVEDLLGV